MMEPVAWRTYQGGFVHTSRPELAADWGDGAEPLVRLSDAEARIAKLERELKREAQLATSMAEDRNDAEARAEAAEALLKEAREALKASSELIDRMMHVHVAPDECTSYVQPSRKWFMENGGSLAAIADQQAMNRRALKEKP